MPHGRKLSLRAGLAAAFIVGVFSIFLPNYYQSEAKILPVDSKSSGNLGQMAAAAAAMGINIPGMDSGDANFIDILNSRTIREDLLHTEFYFQVRSWRFGPIVLHKQTLYDYLGKKNIDRAVKSLDKLITVTRDTKSKIISIKVETKSPELSQQIAQTALESLENFELVKGRTKGGEKARFAKARLQESRDEMAKSEDIFRKFVEINRGYQASTDPAVRLTGARLEAELKLRQQLVVTLAMNLEQSLLEEKNDIPIVNVLDSANLPCENSSPLRVLMAILAFFAALIGTLIWSNREWLHSRMLNEDV
jgi:uncharacterized protein involved in exopolysaccharide biosynthesis